MNLGRRSFSGPSRTIGQGQNTQTEIGNGTFLGRIISRGSGSTSSEPVRALEELIDLEANLDVYRNHQTQLLNPRTLYQTGPLNLATSLLRINREECVTVTTEAVNLDIVNKETLVSIKKTGKRLVHLGLIVVGIKGMTRKQVGCKALLVILDKSWKSDARKATIATIEMDMDKNIGLFYCSPDIILSVNDLHNIVIGIQTRGYEDLVRTDGNLLINVGFLGRLTNSSNIRYKLNIDGIIKTLTSKGIKLLEPMKIDSSEFEGLEWNITKNLGTPETTQRPEKSLMYKNRDGSYSLRFSHYTNQHHGEPEEETEDG